MLDLHLHSDASDGEATFATVVAAIAARPDLRLVSLTDHDAIEASVRLAAIEPARTWVGAELTSFTGAERMDLLALGVRPDDGPLNAYLVARKSQRRDRFALFGELLRADGWTFEPPADIWAQAQLAQPHVVNELRRHEANIARLVGLGVPAQAPVGHDDPIYAKVLNDLAPVIRARTETTVLDGPAMVPLIQAAGGLAVLAHPWVNAYDLGRRPAAEARALMEPLFRAGLDGIELWHSDQTEPATLAEVMAVATEHSLLLTAGSDDHTADLGWLGMSAPPADVAELVLERLLAAHQVRQAG